MNPSALNALIEGKIIIDSNSVRELAEEARRTFVRRGRSWLKIM